MYMKRVVDTEMGEYIFSVPESEIVVYVFVEGGLHGECGNKEYVQSCCKTWKEGTR